MAKTKIIYSFPFLNYSCQEIKDRNCLSFEEIILKLKLEYDLITPSDSVAFLEDKAIYTHARFRGNYSYNPSYHDAKNKANVYHYKHQIMQELNAIKMTDEMMHDILHAKNSMQESLMHYLMRCNEWNLIQVLVKKYPYDAVRIDSDKSGNTLLHNLHHITFDNQKGTIDEKKQFIANKFSFLKFLLSRGLSLETTNQASIMALDKILEKGGIDTVKHIVASYEEKGKTLPINGLRTLILHKRVKELESWLSSSQFDRAHMDTIFNIKHMASPRHKKEFFRLINCLTDKHISKAIFDKQPLCLTTDNMVQASMIALRIEPSIEFFNQLLKANQQAYEVLYFSKPISASSCPKLLHDAINNRLHEFMLSAIGQNEDRQGQYLHLIDAILAHQFELNSIGKTKESIFSQLAQNLNKNKHNIQYFTSLIEILTNHGADIEHCNSRGESVYDVVSRKITDKEYLTLLLNRQSYLEKEKLETMLEDKGERKKFKI